TALDKLCSIVGRVVAQIIKAELVVGHVSDVGGIRLALLDRAQVVIEYPEETFSIALGILPLFYVRCVIYIRACRSYHADSKPKIIVNLSHPSRIAPRQMVI